MRLPILNELLSLDSVIFMVIGLAISLIIGIKANTKKTKLYGLFINLGVYVICEVISQFPITYLVALITLFIGTIAIGGTIGFLISLFIKKK